MLQKKLARQPEHGNAPASRRRHKKPESRPCQRCAAGVPEMDAVDGFSRAGYGYARSRPHRRAHVKGGNWEGGVRVVPRCATRHGNHGVVFHREGSSMRSTSGGVAVAAPRTATMGAPKSAKRKTTRLAARSWKEGVARVVIQIIAQEDHTTYRAIPQRRRRKRGGFRGTVADRKR